MTLKDYFESGKDIFEIGLNDTYHIYIDNIGFGLCVEICDKNGNSININNVDIHYLTFIDDIKDIVID